MAKKFSGLGRGLDAIFLENAPAEEEIDKNAIVPLKISLVDPRMEQPRKTFDLDALNGLAESIKENGLLQPILVRPYADGRYQIIAGERRFRASKIAGLTEIPSIILDKDDQATAQIALIENIQREDLNPVEEAMAYRSLSEEYGMTQEELSARVGKNRSTLANSMRLLDLPADVLNMVASGELSAGHARTLLGCKNRDDMILLAKQTTDNGYTVRMLESAVKLANKPKKDVSDEEETAPVVDYFKEMEERMQAHLGRRVKIQGSGRNKSVTLFYEDNEDLDALLIDICGREFLKEARDD